MRQRNPDTSRGREQPWLLRQFVRPVQPHIGEGFAFPQSLVIAGIIALMFVAFIVLYGIAGQALGGSSAPKTKAPGGAPISTTSATRALATASPVVTRAPGGSAVPTVAATTAPVTVAAPTQAPMGSTAVPTQAGGTKYKVKAGDTLSSIAAKFNVSIQAIMAANNMKSDAIYAGEELIIPSR